MSKVKFIALTMAILMLLMGAVALALPATVWVNVAWTGTPLYTPIGGHTFGVDAFATIADGVNGVAVAGTVNVAAGTYTLPATVAVNKADLTITGAGITTIVKATFAAANPAFNISAAGVTLQNIKLQKTDVPTASYHSLILIAANNVKIKNNLIVGDGPHTWTTTNSCAMEIVSGTGLLIDNNEIINLRWASYITNGVTGTISGNKASGTTGWWTNADVIFTGNTWPSLPVNQGADIVLQALVTPLNLVALSTANSNAYIDATALVPPDQGRAITNIVSPATIASGIAGTLAGGTVNVAAGTYPEYNLLVNKPMTIQGTGLPIIDATGILFPASALPVVDINIASGNVLFDGFKIKTGEHRGINVNAPAALSIVTISHNTLVGNGVNTVPTFAIPDGENFGLYLWPGMSGKVVFDANTVSEFYNNTILAERILGETQVTNNSFTHTWQMFYMTHSAIDITALQRVKGNTFDVSGVTVVAGTHDVNSGVKFETGCWWLPVPNQTGKFTNVEISDNIFNGVSSNTRAIVLQNDDGVAGVPGEILAPKILRNKINGTSLTNTIGMEFKGYIHNAVVTDNEIYNVLVGIKLWVDGHSIYCPDGTALTTNTLSGNVTGLLNTKDVIGNGTLSATSNIFCCGNTTNASDDKPGNTYAQNYWYDWDRAAFPAGYAIGGGGGNVDATPSAAYGLKMTPNVIAYSHAGTFESSVKIEKCVKELNSAEIWLEYPSAVSSVVTTLDPNITVFSTQTTDLVLARTTLKVQLGVMDGTVNGDPEKGLIKVGFTGTTSCIGPLSSDIRMVYRDLRNNSGLANSILAPLADPSTFTSVDPTFVVNTSQSPIGYYNVKPVLSVTGKYSCALWDVEYQIDGVGPWNVYVSSLTDTIYNNTLWSITPAEWTGLGEGLHSIKFIIRSQDGRYNANWNTYTWSFMKDTTPPAAPTDLAATPGHNKVHLSWTNPTVGPLTFDHAIVMRTSWFNAVNGYPLYNLGIVPEGPYPTTLLTGDQVYSGPDAAYINTPIAARDIYHYVVFAVDKAGNVSAPSTGARSTSYWLGDIKPTTYDGLVKVEDLGAFASTYGLSTGNTGYNAEADFAPTVGGPKGIPLPNGTINFEELTIFAINYDAVSATAKTRPLFTGTPIRRETGLRLTQRMTTTTFDVDLYLDNRDDLAKALIGEITYDPTMLEYVSTVEGQDLAASQIPVFFKALMSPRQISVSAAVLGNGSTIDGSGLIATISFRVLGTGKTTVQLTKADVRDKENRSLVADVIQLPEAEAVASVDVPATYEIAQNQPNPFNPETVIKYALPSATQVSIRIYNIVGQLVKTLVDDYQPAGQHQVVWNGTNENGERVASGIYLYRFVTPDHQQTLKMTLLK